MIQKEQQARNSIEELNGESFLPWLDPRQMARSQRALEGHEEHLPVLLLYRVLFLVLDLFPQVYWKS